MKGKNLALLILAALIVSLPGGAASAKGSCHGTVKVINCESRVSLREYAITGAPTVTRVARGQQVDNYYWNGMFCRYFYNGLEGYILSKHSGKKK